MNRTILSGSVHNVKRVEGLSSEAVQFFIRANAIHGLKANKEPTTLVPCTVVNPRGDITALLERKPTIECEGKIIRFSVPGESNSKNYRTQVVIDQRSIMQVPR